MWGSAAAIVLAGWLVGATGIGGVLVVPVLHEMHGMDLRSAIATASLALGFPGIPALWRLLVARRVLPEGTPSLLVASIPGAVAGALLVQYANLTWLIAMLAAPALFTGVWGLRVPAKPAPCLPPLSSRAMFLIGLSVGLGSALSGTGGPVLLMPLLILARQPLPQTVINAQAIQLPIALCAGTSHAIFGMLNYRLALGLGMMLLAASLIGRANAKRLSSSALHRFVCALLLLTGLWLGHRVLI
jgi:uncharacterized membrane protein YfcA